MNLYEAYKIVQDYIDVIGNIPDECVVWKESWLPVSRDEIVAAYKLFLAHVVKFKTLTKEQFDKYLALIIMIDMFVEDELADQINEIQNSKDINDLFVKEPRKKDLYFNYVKHLHDIEIYNEIVEYVKEIQKYSHSDEQYCQKIYTLAGIEYNPEYEKYYKYKQIVNLDKGLTS